MMNAQFCIQMYICTSDCLRKEDLLRLKTFFLSCDEIVQKYKSVFSCYYILDCKKKHAHRKFAIQKRLT